jgi:hypothetical protein
VLQALEVKLTIFKFNKIAVFESLDEVDRPTGREIFDDLEFQKILNIGRLDTSFSKIQNKNEFINILEKLKQEVYSMGVYPIIHIDGHGNDKGIKLGRNSYIEWRELMCCLRELNIFMKGNLLVVLASCFGANIIRHMSVTSRAPFWGVIAPYEETYPENVYAGLNKFYAAICSGKNSKDVLSSLSIVESSNDLKLFTAEYLFVKATELAVSKFLSIGSIDERMIQGKNNGQFTKSTIQLRSGFIAEQKCEFEERLMYFMLVDLHPKNINKISKIHNPWNL